MIVGQKENEEYGAPSVLVLRKISSRHKERLPYNDGWSDSESFHLSIAEWLL
jgi:hypothetical protein